jgi:hypothetical protein
MVSQVPGETDRTVGIAITTLQDEQQWARSVHRVVELGTRYSHCAVLDRIHRLFSISLAARA